MWPMTDAEAVLFMIAVALRAVGGAGAGGRVMAATKTTPLASGFRNGDDGLEQHKGPVEGEQPGPLTPLTGRRLESQDGELTAAT